MKTLILSIVIAICAVSIIGVTKTYAIDPNQAVCSTGSPGAASSDLCKSNLSGGDPIFGPSGLVTTIVNIFSIVVGVVSVIMIMLAGFEYVTSGGESQKINTAKNTIIFALVGVAVVALSQVIVHFVLYNISGF